MQEMHYRSKVQENASFEKQLYYIQSFRVAHVDAVISSLQGHEM